MKKILLSLFSLLIAGFAMAQTVTFTEQKISANDDGFTLDVAPYSFTALKNDGSTKPTQNGTALDLRIYSKNTLQVTTAGDAMTRMVFTVSAAGKKRLTDITASTGDVEIDATAWTVTWTGSATDVTFTVGEKATYGTDGNTKAGQFDVDEVVISTGETKKAAGLKFTPSSVTIEQGDEFTAPTFTKNTTATVTFTTEDDEVATVDADGVITLGGELGVTTITATCEANDEYEAGTATCVITVNKKAEVVVATVAEAYAVGSALAVGEKTTEFYDVTAYVEEVTTAYNASYGNISFKMTDVKGEAGSGLLAYRAAIAEAVTAGAKVQVVGQLQNYNGTIELVSGKATILEKGDEEPEPEPVVIGGLETFENGGFEEWVSDTEVKAWKSTTTASNATLEKSTDAHAGTYSVCVKNATANKRLASKEFKLPAGWYTFQFYAKSATETLAEARPGIAPWDAEKNKMGSYAYGAYTEPLSQTEWTLVSYTFELTAETQVNLVVMNPKSTDTQTFGDLLIDDAELRAATEAEIEAAGINVVTVESNSNILYNIAGQRVSNSYKGIVVKNGKKVLR